MSELCTHSLIRRSRVRRRSSTPKHLRIQHFASWQSQPPSSGRPSRRLISREALSMGCASWMLAKGSGFWFGQRSGKPDWANAPPAVKRRSAPPRTRSSIWIPP
jgi:hypothetical protein